MGAIYRNKFILNQRGATLEINNTTDKEKVKISQRSGSNISLTNMVNSELATNNKQVNVVNDSFETVGKDKTILVKKNHTLRTGENSYALKGFKDSTQLEAFQQWKDVYTYVANKAAQFKIKRGGRGYPNCIYETPKIGSAAKNPVIGSPTVTVENNFSGYSGIPIRDSTQDHVATYTMVPDYGTTTPASKKGVSLNDIEISAGASGSKAPGVLRGAEESAATEGGSWDINDDTYNLAQILKGFQTNLIPIEQKMGDGGDETYLTKRHKFEQVGAVFNDYPSIVIDPVGRSQPFEMLVSTTGAYKNHDAVSHIEEVDNSTNFPCGNDDKVAGNRYSRIVGSGGIQLKTTGSMELGGTVLNAGFKRIHLNSSHGIQIGSEEFIELQSIKSIILRTERQVYIENSLGVKGNVVIGGGAYVEGELYVNHITAPLEVHQTEDTVLYGKFNTEVPRRLAIGEVFCDYGNEVRWNTVYALGTHNLIKNYPHSHHHNGIPIRLTRSNADVRNFAQAENINAHNNVSPALPQLHEKKIGEAASV